MALIEFTALGISSKYQLVHIHLLSTDRITFNDENIEINSTIITKRNPSCCSTITYELRHLINRDPNISAYTNNNYLRDNEISEINNLTKRNKTIYHVELIAFHLGHCGHQVSICDVTFRLSKLNTKQVRKMFSLLPLCRDV